MLRANIEAESGVHVDEWADRSRYWSSKVDATPARRRRERRAEPLVLSGHGLSVRVEKRCLIVKGGNTHYPAEAKELRFFQGGLDIPQRIIAVDGSGTLTLDALDWMAEQGITFVRINYSGSHSVGFGPSGYASDPKKVSWQLETRDNPPRQLKFGIEITEQKLKAALETAGNYLPKSTKQLSALVIIEKALAKLPKAESLSDLLGIEGMAAGAYWAAWTAIEIKWRKSARYPIQDDWLRFSSRSSLFEAHKMANIKATHPVNAMLNYAYAVLLSETRLRAVADGYDPQIGIIHFRERGRRGGDRPSFALDLMEPSRPVVDRAVLKLIEKETFSGADFQLQSDGVCRVNPELGRRVVHEASLVLGGTC